MNWDQLRARIDSGETGDKVAHPDPAVAPLGTDAEAGGFPTSQEEIARSAELQQNIRPERTRRRTTGIALVALALAFGVLIVAMLLLATAN